MMRDLRRAPFATLALSLGAAACGDLPPETTPSTTTTTTLTTTTIPELPAPMAPLPAVLPTKTEQFATSGACNQCHFAGESALLHDADGNDISPAYLWRSSMMAFAAKDPYYLAVWSEAREARPGAKDAIDALCSRCHAPAGSVEAGNAQGTLRFEAIAEGTDAAAHLARDGVTCSLCHQIADTGLGKAQSFSGGFVIGFDRQMLGPHEAPQTQPMQFFVDYTPTFADHVTSSDLCATCHTVIVPLLDASGAPTGGQFVEQAPFFEWQNSSFGSVTPCGHCHLPTTDAAGAPIESPIAKYPDNLAKRSPFGKHTFEGGNAYMLGLLGDNLPWTGSTVPAAELVEAAARGEEHLRGAADLTLVSSDVMGGEMRLVVQVKNLTGHKLPTGYPSRRMWLHVTATAADGAVLLDSGRPGEKGAIESAGARVDVDGAILPHKDEVAPGEAQVWEAVAVDAAGVPTHRPLDQVALGKDNRLLPDGWSTVGPKAEMTKPVGTEGDASFEPGTDRVTFRIPEGAKVTAVTVQLLYQTLPRATADRLAVTPTPAAVRFSQMVAAKPPAPVVMATATLK